MAAMAKLFKSAEFAVLADLGDLHPDRARADIDHRRQPGIVHRVAAAAFLHRHDHFPGDFGEGLSALRVRRALGFLYIMPFGMSRHANSS